MNDLPARPEAAAARLGRLRFRAWHRGMREMDLILGRFADSELASLTAEELADFEALLELPDPDLFAWISEAVPVPPVCDTPLFRRLKAFHTHSSPLNV